MSGTLLISEMFYSLQGEGPTAGRPAVFLRLTGCVCSCSWCDSVAVWRRGKHFTVEELLDIFNARGWTEPILIGNLRLVLTGGDPLIQQRGLAQFLELLLKPLNRLSRTDAFMIELETEAKIIPELYLVSCVGQFNVSPKLSNAGPGNGPNPEAIELHVLDPYSFFKFVVGGPDDLEEVTSMMAAYLIPKKRTMLMPQCITQKEHMEQAPKVAEWAKQLGVGFSPRLQVLLWNKTIGV